MPLPQFHPAVHAWFSRAFPGGATAAQLDAWPAIAGGGHALIAAPTGSGKTLAAFLAAIDSLMREGAAGRLQDVTRVVYVSPLKALSNDIQRNLEAPLAGISAELITLGLQAPEIRAQVRTGDTSQTERAMMRRRPPHILVTTPESLYLLLTSVSGREMLATVRTVIVDEIHAVAQTKRGAHLSLTLERLAANATQPIQRIGLSATQKPIEEVAKFLVGDEWCRSKRMGTQLLQGDKVSRNLVRGRSSSESGPDPICSGTLIPTIVNSGHVRERDINLVIPPAPLEAVMSGEVWATVYDQLAQLISEHHTTLIFANTRRMVERVSRASRRTPGRNGGRRAPRLLSKETRFDAEQRLKAGSLKVMVATASLELGIDIGDVELVCQLGSPRSISTFLQRVGRANHSVGGVPKGRIFPSSRDELVDCTALLDAVRRGELDRAADSRASARRLVAADRRGSRRARIRRGRAVQPRSRRLALSQSRAPRLRCRRAHARRRHRDAARPPRRLSTPRRGQQGAARAQGRAPHRHHLRRRDSRQRGLPGDPRAGRHFCRHAQRRLRHRESRGRHLPAWQHLVPHPARRSRPRARRRRQGPTADDSVLARRGSRAHRRIVRVGIASARGHRSAAARGQRRHTRARDRNRRRALSAAASGRAATRRVSRRAPRPSSPDYPRSTRWCSSVSSTSRAACSSSSMRRSARA